MTSYTYQDGRIWVQDKKFQSYKLLLPYGMTDITDPVGGLNPVREPNPGKRRSTVVTDILRGEPGLPGFTLETRLKKTLNYMLKAKNRTANYQVHMGACERPDNYNASEIGFGWNAVHRGDLSIDRVAQIQGDNTPIAKSVPFQAESGPLPIDFGLEFLSAQTIAETDTISDIAMITEECDDISTQHEPGDNGYAVSNALAGSPVNVANVWYTSDGGTNWAECTERPFAAGIDISSVVVIGDKYDHRVIVSAGTASGGYASIAYADVTTMGTTSWVTVTVGTVTDQYIHHLFALDWQHLYAVTDDGYCYRSDDGGATWSAILSLGTNDFWESSWHREGIGWIAADNNVAYLTKDYGASWSAVTGPSVGNNLTTVCITPDKTALFGTSAGGVYGTFNEGKEWSSLPLQGITATNVARIRAVDNDIIWAVATISGGRGYALRSTDGGAQFRLWSLNMPVNTGLSALFVVDPNYVYVGGAAGFITKASSQIIAAPA